MKQLIAIGALFAAGAGLAPAPALATDVGVSVHISQPGIYGRVDIGRFPQPQLVVAQPVLVVQRPVAAVQPVYMWVPPGHRKNWRRHCGAYNACGVPVYFVQDQWYERHVKPHAHGPGKHKDKHKNKGHDKGRDGKGKHGD